VDAPLAASEETALANARLIAAAPEMYELIRWASEWHGPCECRACAFLARIDAKETP